MTDLPVSSYAGYANGVPRHSDAFVENLMMIYAEKMSDKISTEVKSAVASFQLPHAPVAVSKTKEEVKPMHKSYQVQLDFNDKIKELLKEDTPARYSRKVFVGGLPIDTKESTVRSIFSKFGKVLIDWPRRLDSKPDQIRPMAGYVFLVFEEEASVQRLISKCLLDSGSYWLFVTSDTMKLKPVQVRPWKLGDSDYMIDPNYQMDSRLTVFIGGVPRPTRAVEIANALNQIYGPIAYVGVDTDPELKYPKGCARVTFATASGYIAALKQRHVELNHTDTPKRVEIKPYLMEEQMCDNCFGTKCHGQHAQYFCGFDQCLQYYCARCWDHIHASHHFGHHRPTVRQGDQTKVLDYVPHHPTNNRTSTHRAVYLKYGGHRG